MLRRQVQRDSIYVAGVAGSKSNPSVRDGNRTIRGMRRERTALLLPTRPLGGIEHDAGNHSAIPSRCQGSSGRRGRLAEPSRAPAQILHREQQGN